MSYSPIYLHRAQLGEVSCLETRLSKIIGSVGVVSAHTTAFVVFSRKTHIVGTWFGRGRGHALLHIAMASPGKDKELHTSAAAPTDIRRALESTVKVENGHPGKVMPLIILTREPGFF